MESLNEFPDEILTKILELLPFESRLIVSQVCKRWHYIVVNSIRSKTRFCIRWKQIKGSNEDNSDQDFNELKAENEQFYIKGLTILSQSYTNVCNLLLESINIDFSDSSHLKLWKQLGNTINCLQLLDCTITDIELLNIISKCDHLVKLHLNSNHYFVKNRDTKRNYSVDLVGKRIIKKKNLKELNLSGSNSFKLCDALFVIIGNECKSLEVLDVSNCKIIYHSGIIRRYYFDTEDYWKKATEYAFTFAILKTFFSKFGQHIKKLNFSYTNMCNEHLLQLVFCEQLQHLEEINVENCLLINDNNIIDIRKLKPNIKFLYP